MEGSDHYPDIFINVHHLLTIFFRFQVNSSSGSRLVTPDLHGPGPCQAVLRYIQTYEKEPDENSCSPDSSGETDCVTVTDDMLKVEADLTFSSEQRCQYSIIRTL